MVEPKVGRHGLHPIARAARKEAIELLGEKAGVFRAAIRRYVNAVEVADEARRAWEREERPLMHRFSNGVEGMHPLVTTMEKMERQAAAFGASLGLDPVSAARLVPKRAGPGRPLGSVSAPDRVGVVEPVKLRSVKK